MCKGKWALDHCPTPSWLCIKYQLIIISINNIICNGECGIKFWNGCMNIQTKKMYNENKSHHNARNSYGTSSLMKDEGFHLRYFFKIFVFKGISHSTKWSLHVWLFVMIHAISTPLRCASNTVNVNKWNFTSLVPKVASIEIAPLSSNETMDYN